jgi:hypothetical protein
MWRNEGTARKSRKNNVELIFCDFDLDAKYLYFAKKEKIKPNT